MSHVAYAPETEKLRNTDHWEVWDRLPLEEYNFEETLSSGGKLALRSAHPYIWVMPDARNRHCEKGGGPFMVLVSGNNREAIVDIARVGENVVDVAMYAANLNGEIAAELLSEKPRSKK